MKWDRTKGRPEPIRALNRILEQDNGEPLVNLKEVAPEIVIFRAQTIPYCRAAIAEMLKRAADLAGSGYRLGVTDAWRPIERQQRIYDFVLEKAREAFPGRSALSLRRTVCTWVAPTDQKAPPGHCTGAAVDVWLLDSEGTPVDVNSPFSRFQAARTYTLGLSPEAQANRSRLVDSMLEVGFSNCRDEWWHYSYGDAGWAVRTDRTTCFYGLATLDPSLYVEEERRSVEEMATRGNPFLE